MAKILAAVAAMAVILNAGPRSSPQRLTPWHSMNPAADASPWVSNVFLHKGLDPTIMPCPADPVLRNSPVPPENIANLNPLATLVPPDHVFPTPHMYFYVKNDATDIESPVLAPGDLVVTSIGLRHYERIGQKTDYTDFTLTFAVCRDVVMYFHHVRSLTHPDLVAALAAGGCRPGGSGNETFCSFQTRVFVAAGELIGSAGDRLAGVGGLDLGARDYRLPYGRTAFANPDRWCGSAGTPNIYDRCFTVCPLDYLPAASQATLLDRFVDYTGTVVRVEEPRCGDIYLDLEGSAQGHWFRTGQTIPNVEAPHLFLGPSAFGSDVQEFSVGTSVPNLPSGPYLYRPRTEGLVNRRFADIVPGPVYCFEALYRSDFDAHRQQNAIPNLRIFVQLADDVTMTVSAASAASCGAGTWSFALPAGGFVR